LELVRAATAEIESLRQQLAESKVILQEAQALRSRLAEADALLREIAGHRQAVAFFAPQLAGVIGALNRIDAHLARKP
jgi:hypothetical protein